MMETLVVSQEGNFAAVCGLYLWKERLNFSYRRVIKETVLNALTGLVVGLATPEPKFPGHAATCWLHLGLRCQKESKTCTWLMIWPPDTQFILMCTQSSSFGRTQTDTHLSSCVADAIGSKVHCNGRFTGPYVVGSTTSLHRPENQGHRPWYPVSSQGNLSHSKATVTVFSQAIFRKTHSPLYLKKAEQAFYLLS